VSCGDVFRKGVLVVMLAAAVESTASGCAPSRKPIGIPLVSTARFEAELRKYASFGLRKSLALAGDPHGVYVLGYGHALAEEEDAIARALADCEVRREDRRISEPCRTIAIDNELLEGNPFAAF
jgi:hypothetical protein